MVSPNYDPTFQYKPSGPIRRRTSGGARQTVSARTAGAVEGSCRVDCANEMEAVILAENEVLMVFESLAENLNNWRTEIDLLKNLKGQVDQLQLVLREFGWKGSAYVKTIQGKRYVILKGHAGLREVLRGTKYLADNAKVVAYGLGKQGLKTVKGNFVTIIFLTAVNVIEAIVSDDKDFIDATAQFTTDVTKTIAAAVAGAAAGAVATAFAAPVVVAVGVVVVVGIVASLLLDQIDSRFEITASLSEWLHNEYEEAARDLREQQYQIKRQWMWCNSPQGAAACMQSLFGY